MEKDKNNFENRVYLGVTAGGIPLLGYIILTQFFPDCPLLLTNVLIFITAAVAFLVSVYYTPLEGEREGNGAILFYTFFYLSLVVILPGIIIIQEPSFWIKVIVPMTIFCRVLCALAQDKELKSKRFTIIINKLDKNRSHLIIEDNKK